MTEAGLYALQRLTAAVMAPMVLVHLATILYAVRGGLTAGEILARTGGATAWTLFYALFVLAASVHAPLGLRKILVEWTGLGRTAAGWIALGLGCALALMGFRAVLAVGGVLP